jgi:hypothetical protein
MINRVLIRLKIVQIIYAYYQNGGKNLDTAEKELFFSLSKAYDLYNYLLLLMVEVTKYANKRLDVAKNKLVPTKEDFEKFMNGLQQAIDFIGHEQGTTSEAHYQPATATEEMPSQSEEIKIDIDF